MSPYHDGCLGIAFGGEGEQTEWRWRGDGKGRDDTAGIALLFWTAVGQEQPIMSSTAIQRDEIGTPPS